MKEIYGVHNLKSSTKQEMKNLYSSDNEKTRERKSESDKSEEKESSSDGVNDTCIPGMTHSEIRKLSTKRYIEEFAKGTCSPIVISPGIAGC